jgi:hypothetical protein
MLECVYKIKGMCFDDDNRSPEDEDSMGGSFLTIINILTFMILKHPGIGNFKSCGTVGVAARF